MPALVPPERPRRVEIRGRYDGDEAKPNGSLFGLMLALGVVIAVLGQIQQDEPAVTVGQVAQLRLLGHRKVPEAEPFGRDRMICRDRVPAGNRSAVCRHFRHRTAPQPG